MRGPRLAAEIVGTFMLVLIGPGAAATNAWTGGALTQVGIALAFGCVILAAIYALGHISGAHFNPAVTFGFWLSGRFPGNEVAPYIGAQLVGASVAAGCLRLVLGQASQAAVTLSTVGRAAGFGLEVLLTFILILVVMAVATDARVTGAVAGVAIGLTVAGEAFMAGALTGASMNPARSFGPALATGVWTAHWLYWIGPLLGSALAVPAYAYLRQGSTHDYRDPAASPGPLSLHRQLGAEPDGRGAAQSQGPGTV